MTNSPVKVSFERNPARNLTNECVGDYEPAVDYFPDKVRVQHTARFRVDYAKHYKVVTFEPTVYTQETIRYVLVQCGTPGAVDCGSAGSWLSSWSKAM